MVTNLLFIHKMLNKCHSFNQQAVIYHGHYKCLTSLMHRYDFPLWVNVGVEFRLF